MSAVCNMKPLAVYLNFPGGLLVKKPPAKVADTSSTLVQGDPWEKEMVPARVFLPRKPHGQGSLVDEVHGVARLGHD